MQVILIQKKQYKLINHYQMLKANILMKFLIQGIQNKKWIIISSVCRNNHLPLSINFNTKLRNKKLIEWIQLISRMLKHLSLIKTLFFKIKAYNNKTTVQFSKNLENDWINNIISTKGFQNSLIIVIMRDQNSIILANMIVKWIKKKKIMTMEMKIRRNKIMFKIYKNIKKISKSIIILHLQYLIITSQMFKMMLKS